MPLESMSDIFPVLFECCLISGRCIFLCLSVHLVYVEMRCSISERHFQTVNSEDDIDDQNAYPALPVTSQIVPNRTLASRICLYTVSEMTGRDITTALALKFFICAHPLLKLEVFGKIVRLMVASVYHWGTDACA
jgi:hypothetical protein